MIQCRWQLLNCLTETSTGKEEKFKPPGCLTRKFSRLHNGDSQIGEFTVVARVSLFLLSVRDPVSKEVIKLPDRNQFVNDVKLEPSED
jgi:hypothetical protein